MSRQPVAAESSAFPLATTGPRLVYVLENDHISSVITELIVKKNLSGGQVRCYPNGQMAFDDLAAAVRTGIEVPDLILMDLDMPVMDGWDFLDALGSLPEAQAVCVFVLTSSIHPDDLVRAKSYRSVNGFFTKPLDEDSIVCMQVLLQQGQAQVQSAALAPMAVALDAINYTQVLPLETLGAEDRGSM